MKKLNIFFNAVFCFFQVQRSEPKTSEKSPVPAIRGNTTYLTPEKNELITRYMESQTEALRPFVGEEVDSLLNQENEEPLKEKKDREKRRKRKKNLPPPSYGPLHPPIMSSTQKSSEFIDLPSASSIVCSEASQPANSKHHIKNKEIKNKKTAKRDMNYKLQNLKKLNKKDIRGGDELYDSLSNDGSSISSRDVIKEKGYNEMVNRKKHQSKVEFSNVPTKRLSEPLKPKEEMDMEAYKRVSIVV